MDVISRNKSHFGFKILLAIKAVIILSSTVTSPFADQISYQTLDRREIETMRKMTAKEFHRRRCQTNPSEGIPSLGANVYWTVGSSFKLYQLSCNIGAYLETTAWYRVEKGRLKPLRIKHPVFIKTNMNTGDDQKKNLQLEKFIFDHFLVNAILDPKTGRLTQNSYCCAGDLFRRTSWGLKESELYLESYEEDFVLDGRHEPQFSFKFKK